jgi:putative aldouronate transport system substrate-binding protein
MGDAHNYTDLINNSGGWIPLNRLNDYTGSNVKVTGGKSGYCAWAVNADGKNPEEVFRFMDYLSTPEGQLLGAYGIEGLTYSTVNGRPRLNAETAALLNAGDTKALINRFGFAFGGVANYFFECASTNKDNRGLFGEDRPGMSGSAQYANAVAIGTKYPNQYRLVEGLNATAYLSNENMAGIKAKMDLLNYKDTFTQAVFASSDAEARRILEAFKQQLSAAGVKDFESYLEGIYRADRRALNFR